MHTSNMALRRGSMLIQLSLLLMVELAILAAAQVLHDYCTKSCGGIAIPYPFGIESGCYLEVEGQDPPPFKVNCSSTVTDSTTNDDTTMLPFLFMDSGSYTPLVIGSFSVGSNELQVKMKISLTCSADSENISRYRDSTLDLPFSYTISSNRNTFFVVGCSKIAVLYRGFTRPTDQDTVKVGTTVLNLCEGNKPPKCAADECNKNCAGNWCNKDSIIRGLHNITLALYGTLTEDPNAKNKNYPCSYGFIVDAEIFKFNGDDSFNFLKNPTNQELPVVVNWAIGDGNCSAATQNTTSYACRAANSECVDQFASDNTTRGYFCKCRSAYAGNPYIEGGCTADNVKKCNTKCGDVEIQYPFGIEDDCFMKVPRPKRTLNMTVKEPDYDPFRLTCDHSTKQPSLKFHNVPKFPEIIANINFAESELQVMVDTSRTCLSTEGTVDDSLTRKGTLTLPHYYTISAKNMVYTVGCNKIALYSGLQYEGDLLKEKPQKIGTGGVALCEKYPATEPSCDGTFGCARYPMSSGQSYISISTSVATSSDSNSLQWINKYPCGYGFIVANENFTFNLNGSFNELENRKQFPVAVNWEIGENNCDAAKKTKKYACKAANSTCGDGFRGGYFCRCQQGYKGNPYISDGCTDIEECKLEPSICGENANCQELNGTYRCNCHDGYTNIGNVQTNRCEETKTKTSTLMKITLGVCLSFLVVLIVTFVIYREMKKRRSDHEKQKANERKLQNYENNGGPLLQKKISEHFLGPQPPRIIFTLEELTKATREFREQIGNGSFYKGILPEEKPVAINKSDKIAPVTESNINELIVLFQISHNIENDQNINIARLLGCCLETERPSLVYEFIGNGTLHDHIHKESGKEPLPFGLRLNIAAETAESLAHLHQKKIVHRDVKTTHILLDANLTAKVSDFGASNLVLDDKNKLSTLVQGTLGYLDPEYLQSNTLTEKSDVYSFGVVLVELITSKEAVSKERSTDAERNLAMFFVSSLEGKRLEKILDHDVIIKEGHYETAAEVANLAKGCLCVKGGDRPSMKIVADKLRELLKNLKGKPDQLRASPSNSHTVESGGGDEAR